MRVFIRLSGTGELKEFLANPDDEGFSLTHSVVDEFTAIVENWKKHGRTQVSIENARSVAQEEARKKPVEEGSCEGESSGSAPAPVVTKVHATRSDNRKTVESAKKKSEKGEKKPKKTAVRIADSMDFDEVDEGPTPLELLKVVLRSL